MITDGFGSQWPVNASGSGNNWPIGYANCLGCNLP
jgi:hypothetical protein